MANLTVVLKELVREQGRLNDAIKALRKVVGRNHAGISAGRAQKPRRRMSAAARRRIAAAQRARWAKWKAKHVKKAA